MQIVIACRLDDPRFDFGNPAPVILDLLSNSNITSNPASKASQGLPDSTTSVDAWAALSLAPERTGSCSTSVNISWQQTQLVHLEMRDQPFYLNLHPGVAQHSLSELAALSRKRAVIVGVVISLVERKTM